MTAAYDRYCAHKRGAKHRGIEFQFTFEEWVGWWEIHLGPDWIKKRGKRWDQYVMARIGDSGAYHVANVLCLLSSQNHTSQVLNKSSNFGERHGRAKLTKQDVLEIRNSQLTSVVLSKIYKVSNQQICDIRNRKRWTHL